MAAHTSGGEPFTDGYQQVMRHWWQTAQNFDLVASELVLLEAGAGDGEGGRHIANAVRRSSIERACRRAGYEPVVICTPNELTETSDEDVTN